MYERHHEHLLPYPEFLRRLAQHGLLSLLLIAGSLLIGMEGYHGLEGLPWLDAFLNAAMLLGGMGPVEPLRTDGGKLFAGLYALYSGMLFLVAVGILFAPVLHRWMHRFHLEQDGHDGD